MLRIGSGRLDLGLYASPASSGARLEALHRASRAWSLYGSAWGGYSPSLRAPDWGALGGVRARW